MQPLSISQDMSSVCVILPSEISAMHTTVSQSFPNIPQKISFRPLRDSLWIIIATQGDRGRKINVSAASHGMSLFVRELLHASTDGRHPYDAIIPAIFSIKVFLISSASNLLIRALLAMETATEDM
jgi:hypothetical protein